MITDVVDWNTPKDRFLILDLNLIWPPWSKVCYASSFWATKSLSGISGSKGDKAKARERGGKGWNGPGYNYQKNQKQRLYSQVHPSFLLHQTFLSHSFGRCRPPLLTVQNTIAPCPFCSRKTEVSEVHALKSEDRRKPGKPNGK